MCVSVFLLVPKMQDTDALRQNIRTTTATISVVNKAIDSPLDREGPAWKKPFTRNELWSHLNCDTIVKQKQLPIQKKDEWQYMRTLYTSIVGQDNSTVGTTAVLAEHNGFAQPYYVRHNQFGRGIYAAMDIPEGALVWQNTRKAQFTAASAFREFVLRLAVPKDNGLGCDVLQWAYVDFDSKINVDLDEGSFCNDGHKTHGNIAFDEDRSNKSPVKPSMQLFALRDILQDEELLCYYGSFTAGGWDDVGM